MNDRHMGRSAVNPKGGQMEPNRGKRINTYNQREMKG